MPQKNRKQLSSPESFAQAFNKRESLYKNPKNDENNTLMSIKLVGQGKDGKLKESKIYLPGWTVTSLQINFSGNLREIINLKEVEERIKEERRQQAPKRKQQKKKQRR